MGQNDETLEMVGMERIGQNDETLEIVGNDGTER